MGVGMQAEWCSGANRGVGLGMVAGPTGVTGTAALHLYMADAQVLCKISRDVDLNMQPV